MKIYTATFDLAYPSNNRFWVAPYSDFKIGIKILKAGEDYEGEFTVKANGSTLAADETKVAGFTTYTLKSLGPGSATYVIEAAGAQQKFYLVQTTSTSTVFDIATLSGGGDVPADVATQSWVEAQISNLVDEDELTAYATSESLTAYATTGSLTAYATTNDLTSKADTSSLTAYATQAEVSSIPLSVAQIDSIAQGAYSIANTSVQQQEEGTAGAIVAISKLYESEWEQISADNPEDDVMYVILPDPE